MLNPMPCGRKFNISFPMLDGKPLATPAHGATAYDRFTPSQSPEAAGLLPRQPPSELSLDLHTTLRWDASYTTLFLDENP